MMYVKAGIKTYVFRATVSYPSHPLGNLPVVVKQAYLPFPTTSTILHTGTLHVYAQWTLTHSTLSYSLVA